MNNKLNFLGLILILAASLGLNVISAQANPLNTPNAYDIIAAINGLRATKGQAALQTNASLMAAAQGQSDYQASIDTWTHTGAGGSTPVERDMAAGYGGGAKIFTSENVAYLSTSTTINTLIYSIWADSVHWATMINPDATDCGVGITEKSGFVYYTLDVSYTAGQPTSSNGTTAPTALPGTEVTAAATVGGVTATPSHNVTLQVATPQDDGKVVHIVQAGQALSSIAFAYGVKIADLRALNNIAANNNTVYVGQKLLIRAAFTLTPSPTDTDTLPPPTRTLAPTHTKGPPPATRTAAPTQTITPLPLLPKLPTLESNARQSIGIILVVICGLGLVGVLVSYLIRKKQP